MGMLEIRRASANLNNLGQFRMPELDNGSARAFAAKAEAAKSAAAAARVAGHAAIEGISRRGQIVAKTLGDLGKVAVEIANRENERIATNAFLASENDRNLYMTGDGTDKNPGHLNATVDKDGKWDASKWLDDYAKAAEKRRETFTKDLSGPQRAIYERLVAKRDVEWNARLYAHAAATTLKHEVTTATAALGEAKDNAVKNFDDATFRDSSIAEMLAAKEREMEARKVPEAARAAERKALAEDYLVNLATAKFTEWKNQSEGQDPETVEHMWTEQGRALEGLNGEVIGNEDIRKALGSDTLDPVRRALLEKRFIENKNAAIGRAYQLRRQNWDAAHKESLAEEIELLDQKTNPFPEKPEEREAYFSKMASAYSKLAENTTLEPSVRLHYAQTASRLSEHALAEKTSAATSAAKAAEDAREDAFKTASAHFTLGKWNEAAGCFEPYRAAEIADGAKKLFVDGKIDFLQYSGLMKIQERKADKEGDAFLESVAATIKDNIPNMLRYNADENRIEAFPVLVKGKSRTPDEKSSVKTSDGDRWLYSQLAEAADLTLDWMRKNNKTVPEAVKMFGDLTSGSVSAHRKAKVEDALKGFRSFIDGDSPALTPPPPPVPTSRFYPSDIYPGM